MDPNARRSTAKGISPDAVVVVVQAKGF
jgi:hypothetical protein